MKITKSNETIEILHDIVAQADEIGLDDFVPGAPTPVTVFVGKAAVQVVVGAQWNLVYYAVDAVVRALKAHRSGREAVLLQAIDPHKAVPHVEAGESWVDNPPPGDPASMTIAVGRVAIRERMGPGCDVSLNAVESVLMACAAHLKVAPDGIYPDGKGAPFKRKNQTKPQMH